MRRIATFAGVLAIAGTAVLAQDQDDDRGFFGRLFGGDDAAEEEDQGGFLERTIEDNLSGEGRNVEVIGFEGVLSGEATMEKMTIADEDGVWLTLENVVLDWSRAALLRGRLNVQELTAERIELARLPAPGEPEGPTPEAQGFSLPELPVAINIGQISAERVILGEPVIGEAVEVTVDGSMSLDGGEGEAKLDIVRLDGEGEFTLDVGYANETRNLRVDIDINEGPGGILASLAGIPGEPAVEFTIKGDAPLSDFTAEVALLTDGVPRLTGTIETSEPESPGKLRVVADLGGDIAPLFAPDYQEFFGNDVAIDLDLTTYEDGSLEISRVAMNADAMELEGRIEVASTGVPSLIQIDGEIASGDGEPVLLPFGGGMTRVDRVVLDVAFDASDDETWTGRFAIDGLDRPGFGAEQLLLSGRGRMVPGDEGGRPTVTASLDVDATALDLATAEASDALGERVTGHLDISWSEGQPIRLTNLDISGESYGLSGETTIQTAGPLDVSGALQVRADDLSEFSGIAARELGGSVDLATEFSAQPMAGTFEISLSGTTEDLVVDQEQADAILAGRVILDATATRTENGIRAVVRELSSPNAELVADIDLKSDGSRLSISGSLADSSIVLPDVSGPVNIRAQADQSQGVWTWAVDGDVASATLDAEGTAAGLSATPVVAAAGTLRVGDLSEFATISGQDLAGTVETRFSGEVVTDLSRIDANLIGSGSGLLTGIEQVDRLLEGAVNFRIDGARAGNVITLRDSRIESATLEIAADGTLIDGAPRFTGSIRAEDASRILPQAPAIPLEADVSVQAATDGTWDVDVTADGPQLSLTADGKVIDPYGTPGFDGDLALNAGDLSLFADLANRPLSGSIDMQASGRAISDFSAVDMRATGTARSLKIGMADIDPLLDGLVNFDADIATTGDDIDVDATLTAPDLALDIDGRVLDPAGTPGFDGSVTARADNLAAFSGLAGRDLAGSLTLDAQGRVVADLSTLDLTASGRGLGLQTGIDAVDRLLVGQLTFATDVEKSGERIGIDRLTLSTDVLRLSGSGDIGPTDSTARLTVEADDASRLMPGAPALPVSLVAALDQAGENWLVDADLSGPRTTATINGTISDPYGTPAFDGRISADADDLSIFAGLTGQNLSGSLSVDAEGRVMSDLSSFDITASADGSGVGIGQPLADDLLAGPLSVRLVAEGGDGGQRIVLDTLTASTGQLQINGSGELNGTAGSLDFDARIANVAVLVPGFPGPGSVRGTIGRRDDGRFTLDVTADGPGGVTADINGTTAPDFSTMDLDIDGQLPLALINGFIEPKTLEGLARFDLSLNGPPALGSLSGQVSATGARLVMPALRIVLNGIDMTANLSNGSANLNIVGQLGEGGRVTVTGPIGLEGAFPANLRVQLDNAVFTDPQLYETIINGGLTISGGLTGGATIAGDLRLGETIVRIPSSGLGGSGAVPEVTHINEPPPVRATRRRAGLLESQQSGDGGGGGQPYALNIAISAPNQVFVRGRGLDAEFGGSLRITGTTNDVVPIGAFNLIRGRLDILGQRLSISEATISIQGSFLPVIRVRATTQTDDYDISIVVSGPASNPDIDFVSEPDLPEEEVVARLLFGRGIQELSPVQAARLALAVRTLAGRGGEGIVGNLRNRTGLADLDITTDDEGNAAVRAGAYLTENLYTDVTVGAGGETELNLNLDITRSLTAKGTVTNEGETSLGIFFEKDY